MAKYKSWHQRTFTSKHEENSINKQLLSSKLCPVSAFSREKSWFWQFLNREFLRYQFREGNHHPEDLSPSI